MNQRRTLLVGAAAAVFAFAAAPAADAGTARPVVQVARAGCSWSSVDVAGGFQLHAVSAVSGSDVWAVGNANAVHKPFAVHYDGSEWKAVPVPTKGPGAIDLYDVDMISKTNAWAVGYYVDSHGHSRTLTEHWDGTRWKIVPSPNKGTGDNTFRGVAAVSASHVWAVGYRGPTASEQRPLIEHWNGSSWKTEEEAASQVGSAKLWAVSATAGGAQWAVGQFVFEPKPLVERKLGTAWDLKSPNNVGTTPNALKGVSALSATSAFAVGSYTTSGGTRRALANRFGNGQWTTFKPPNATPFDNQLESVAAISASNVWAVGYAAKDASGHTLEPLIEHFHC